MKSFIVYKFNCASCSSSYIGKTCHHFKTRIEEHTKKHNKSHIFKHLHFTTICFDLSNSLSFKIIDKANSIFNLKIEESLHINWRKPNLNPQQSFSCHTFTIACITLLLLSVIIIIIFSFLFHLLFSSSSTLIISIFYCLNSLLSYLQFAITLSPYNTPCIAPLPFFYYIHYLWHKLSASFTALIKQCYYFISL